MKKEYKNSSNKNGIYFIRNISNNRVYVGSTIRFKKRYGSHYNSLIKGSHPNTFLQNDFNKCGEDNFIFEVIEVLEKNECLLDREQFYLDQYYDNQKNCYNLRPDACDSRAGKKNKKPYNPKIDGRSKPKTEEWRKVTSKKNKEFWNKPKNKKFASDRAKKKWKDHSANITLVNRETKEEVFVDTSLRQFAVERGLSYKSLNQLVNKKIKSSGGWYVKKYGEPKYTSQKGQKRKPLSKEHRDKIAGGKYVGTKLVHMKTGKVIEVTMNTKEFAKRHNFCYSTLMKVLNGQCNSTAGYVLSSF